MKQTALDYVQKKKKHARTIQSKHCAEKFWDRFGGKTQNFQTADIDK